MRTQMPYTPESLLINYQNSLEKGGINPEGIVIKSRLKYMEN